MRQLSKKEAFPFIKSVLAAGDLKDRRAIKSLTQGELIEARSLARSQRYTLARAAEIVRESRR